MCAMFVANKYSASLEDTYHLSVALRTCADNHFYVPFAVRLVDASNVAAGVRVTNVLDGPISTTTGVKAVLKSIVDANDGSNVAGSGEMSADAASGGVLFKLPAEAVSKVAARGAGWYKLRMTVAPIKADERLASEDTVVRTFKVAATVSFNKVELFATENSKGTGVADADIKRYVAVCVACLRYPQPALFWCMLVRS